MERSMRARRGAAVLMAVGALGLMSACGGGGSAEKLSADDTIVVSFGGDPMTMSPFDYRAGVNFYGTSQMYERLLARDTDGQLIPWLATEYSASDDGKTFTFKLRDDVTFHNGARMTSADVKFSLERYADPEITAYAVLLSGLEKIDTPDDTTVVAHFSTPKPLLLSAMGNTFIVPASIGDEPKDHLDTQAIGTGPFKLTDRKPGQGFTLERFDDYWGEPSGFAEIDVQVNADANARVSALRSGQADFIAPVPSQNVARLEDEFNVVSENDSNAVGVSFNLEDPKVAGVLADERVRRALDIAIDRKAVVDSALNGMGLVHGGMGPQNAGADQVPPVEYDADEAKKLISEAGAEGETVTLYVPKNGRVTNSEQVGQAIAGYWDEAGIKTDLQIVAYEEWIDKMRTGPAQAFLSFQGDEFAGSPIVRAQGYYACNGSTAQMCDKDLDAMITAALTAPDEDAAVASNVAVFQRLQEKSLAISLYVQESAFAMQKGVCWTPTKGQSIPVLAQLKPCD